MHKEKLNKGESLVADVLSSIHASSVYDNDEDDYDENGLWFSFNFLQFNFYSLRTFIISKFC